MKKRTIKIAILLFVLAAILMLLNTDWDKATDDAQRGFEDGYEEASGEKP
ncbi:MAG: hypothetical protein WA958_00660 [Tunicatimonas sp.]